MFSQDYFHDIRAVYDQHLLRFLRAHLPDGQYPEAIEEYLTWDDVRVVSLLREHRQDSDAAAILERRHFRPVYEFSRSDLGKRLTVIDDVRQALEKEFGTKAFLVDTKHGSRTDLRC